MTTITLIVNGKNIPTTTVTSLGKLEVGTKIQIQAEIPAEPHLAFCQTPKTNAVEPKAVKENKYIKNLTVIRLPDGQIVVQGWPGNGMYIATKMGSGLVNLTFHAIVRNNGEFFYVEDSQVVAFHNRTGNAFTSQMRGLRDIVAHIKNLIVGDVLPKIDDLPDVQPGTVLWYAKARNIGAVVIGTDEHEELITARVHVSQILDQTGLPHLIAGQQVTWEGSKEEVEGNTSFSAELTGVRAK